MRSVSVTTSPYKGIWLENLEFAPATHFENPVRLFLRAKKSGPIRRNRRLRLLLMPLARYMYVNHLILRATKQGRR